MDVIREYCVLVGHVTLLDPSPTIHMELVWMESVDYSEGRMGFPKENGRVIVNYRVLEPQFPGRHTFSTLL